MNDEDILELQERRLTDHVRQSVEQSLKRRYSIVGVIVMVLLGGGGYLLVEKALLNTRLSLAESQTLDKFVRDRLANDMPEVEKLVAQFSAAEQQLAVYRKEAASITKELNQQLRETTNKNLDYTQELRKGLADLSRVVSRLAASRPAPEVTEIEREINELDKNLEDSARRIDESKAAFEQNFNRMKEQINIQQTAPVMQRSIFEGPSLRKPTEIDRQSRRTIERIDPDQPSRRRGGREGP